MSNRPSIELNTVQVVASMGAAVTGAILTSYLGNGGTIVGTAVGAGVSTTGFAVYKHYLARTKEKVAPVIVEHARHWSPGTGTGSQPPRGGTPTAPGTTDRTVTSPYRAANGGRGAAPGYGATAGRYASAAPADRTQPWPPGTSALRGRASPPPALGRSDLERADAQNRWYGRVRMGGPGHEGNSSPGTSRDFAGGGAGNGARRGGGPGKHGQASGGGIGAILRDRPRWFVIAVSSAAVFLAALLVITLIEFGTGKPIDASVWGRKASGTTLGNVTGGGQSTSKTVTPTVSPTPTHSATPGGVEQTTPQPSSSGSPAASPSSVPSVSTNPPQNAPASVVPTAPGR